ncbi:uncharacterized protein LOC34623502 [Cyclospora cayetanensis]|uniref:Uncharacterized protein LOC34623502 n=1 Tax=Cyclospora cayetanensis TaxID=88456 RepID=A0A6P6RQY7_9EIME|nr:uncharacterized protein LOC34623502 [Cyclospora cayetanensis]
MLRKNYENFVLLKHKQALVTPGPKKAKDFPRGLVIAYPSGHIVSAATRQHFVGLAAPDSFRGTASKVQTSSGPRDAVQMYADWIRRKFRSHETEPPCSMNGCTRFLNFITRADLPQPSHLAEPLEIYLEEFHDYIHLHFPHWTIVYDPEVSPVMAICRVRQDASPAEVLRASEAAAAALTEVDHKQGEPNLSAEQSQREAVSHRGAGTPPRTLERDAMESPAKIQRRSAEANQAWSGGVTEDFAAASSGDVHRAHTRTASRRLMIPLSQQPRHLWPPSSRVASYFRKELSLAAIAAAGSESNANNGAAAAPTTTAAAAAMAELRVVLLIGAAHIVAHCRSQATVAGAGNPDCAAETNYSQAATSAAVSDVWSILRYFVGSAKERFA